ncbi:MAG: hypothetical protein ABH865_08435 [Candidatus Omnitrophota bacterium]|nr:hypothetical protein [Candidatus Omnitrophota bacterium]
MKTKSLIIIGLTGIAAIVVILASGFERYHVYSEGGSTVLKKEYEQENLHLIYLEHRQVFEKEPLARLLVSLVIVGALLLYVVSDEEFVRYLRSGMKQYTPHSGLTLRVGHAHPTYPHLIITKIAYDGTIRVKGLHGFRDAQLPFVKGLTRRQRKEFQKILARLEVERKKFEQKAL